MTKLTVALHTCLAISPLFLLTIPRWISGILIASCALALAILWLGARQKQDIPVLSTEQKSWLWCFTILFALPFLAVFLGQLFRQDFAWRDYDSPARFLASIPILVVLVKHRRDIVKSLVYSIPCALVITFITVVLKINEAGVIQERMSTYSFDPLTFGSLNLTFGLCCLLSIDLYRSDAWGIKIHKSLGFIVGVFLSILSGSRTGWLAFPLVLGLWLNIKIKGYRILVLMSVVLISIAVYYFSNTVQQRLNIALQEFTAYQWNAINPHDSTGARITFLRMAAFLFSQNPWSGFGDQGFAGLINHPELNRFALPETQEFALRCGFHNEIATNMVRSGIWGLLSSSALFLVPAVLFTRKSRSTSSQTQGIAFLALCYLICTFVSGMTTEVFNLKFTASFHALMFTCFTSSLLIRSATVQEPKQDESR